MSAHLLCVEESAAQITFFVDFGLHFGGHVGSIYADLAKGVTLRDQGHQKELPKNDLILLTPFSGHRVIFGPVGDFRTRWCGPLKEGKQLEN